MELGLKGKTVLVTGGSKGIGRATARAMATEGARNAEASPLRYTIHPQDQFRITMEIEDSGKGISREHLAAVQAGASGFGIRAMRERLRRFGGELQISSAEAGTRVLVSIPLSQPDASQQIEPVQAAT